MGDEGRPFGVALQGEASNSHKLLRAKPAVVNVMVKRRGNDRVMYELERRAQANLRRSIERFTRRHQNRGVYGVPGKSMAGTCLLAMRCPVYRRRDSNLGSHTELENLTGDAKGKGASGDPARLKVPMRRAGAHCSVVVMKRGNARGAKGAGHPRRDRWVNGKPEEPTGFGGRRQPSLGGTSRMMREYHVRICEGLGVKLPGSTRRNLRGDDGDVGIIRSPVRAIVQPDRS